MARTEPSLTLRTIDPDDSATIDAFLAQTAMVFTMPFLHTAERTEFFLPGLRDDRLSGVFEDDRIIGTYRSWDTRVTVPGGGALDADAVSGVTVRPSHRRRGVLTSLIETDLAEARARGLPAAVLVASEGGIYGRFGFGPATEAATWELDVRGARVLPQVPRAGRVDVVEPRDVRKVGPAVFAASRRPAAMDRDDFWWDVRCDIRTPPEGARSPAAAVICSDPGGTPAGYAFFSWKADWPDRQFRTVASVEDLHAATPQAYAALWEFFAGLDLVATVRAHDRPVDEELPWLLADPRAARRTATCDFLWLRLLDLPAAFAARRYECADSLVLKVIDPLGHAAGRFAVHTDADGSGAAVPSEAAADVTLPVDVLSSLYLGGGALHAAVVAGRAVGHTPGAVERLGRLLRTSRAPWTGTWF